MFFSHTFATGWWVSVVEYFPLKCIKLCNIRNIRELFPSKCWLNSFPFLHRRVKLLSLHETWSLCIIICQYMYHIYLPYVMLIFFHILSTVGTFTRMLLLIVQVTVKQGFLVFSEPFNVIFNVTLVPCSFHRFIFLTLK